MRIHRSRKLRWRLAVPLTTAFALLWLGTMALITNFACEKLEQTMSIQYSSARREMEEQWEIYENNLANGLGAEADHIMTYNLSANSMYLTDIAEGGMAFLIRDDAGKEFRSQLAYGYGHEAGVDQGQRWHLYFDSGLDDQGQLQLARWIVEHRNWDWAFSLYPPEYWQGETEEAEWTDLPNFDGTYARVTGIELPGYAVDVQKIELVHPDGSVETMVETNTPGDNPITLEFQFMRVSSVLLPSYGSDGDGPVDMELRLRNFREAQAILNRDAAGEERPVQTSDGGLTGMTNAENGSMRLVSWQCDVFRAALEQQRFLYISTFVLTVLVVLLLSAHLSRKVTGPVEELSQETQEGRCRADGPVRELNALAQAFNSAQDQLEGQLQRERAFTRGAAHELKTPLAVLRTHAEALREDIAPQKREQYLDIILEESDRMAHLVGSLLELSRLEAGAELHREAFNLAALVREVWEPLSLPLEQKHLSLSLKLEDYMVEGDRERLRELAVNLASNALRHCTPGGRIRVTLKAEETGVRLTVQNDGSSISPEDLPHLFEPFYRGDRSRSRESGGTGLGLAIVRAAAQAHGGSCGVENRSDGPLFWVVLPL